MSAHDEDLGANQERASQVFRQFLRLLPPDCGLFASLTVPKKDEPGKVSVHLMSHQDDPNVVRAQIEEARDALEKGLAAGKVQDLDPAPAPDLADPSPN